MSAGTIAQALGSALTLATEGYKCFPCAANKRPATPRGFHDAASEPAAMRELWGQYPAPLVGVATGVASRIDALDLDRKHPEAVEWWATHRHRLPATRTHRTRARGLHLLFQHTAGLRCTAGVIAPGVDTRSDGGYIIWWPAARLPVLLDAPPAPWPPWLLNELNAPRPSTSGASRTSPADLFRYRAGSRHVSAALGRAADRVALAPNGSRNRALNTEAYSIGRLVAEGLLDAQEVVDTLAAAAFTAGLSPREIEATLRSSFRAWGLL